MAVAVKSRARMLKFPLRFASEEGTARIIARMLKEPTGIHFLDSGIYGRHWQRNQRARFARQPYGWWAVDRDRDGNVFAVYPRLSLYWFLRERLVFFPQEDARFRRYEQQTDKYDSWEEVYRGYFHYLGYSDDEIDDREFISRFSSAGMDSFLTQDISGIAYPLPEDQRIRVILLRVHNGADVRGGWTFPRAFVVRGDGDEYDLMQWDRVTIHCPRCRIWLHAAAYGAEYEDEAAGEKHIHIDITTPWAGFFGYPDNKGVNVDDHDRVLCGYCGHPLEVT